MGRLAALALSLIALTAIVACGDDRPDSEAATSRFVQCLERNGVVAQNVAVTLNDDGSVSSIEAQILQEADVAYEPALRLACTQEIEDL